MPSLEFTHRYQTAVLWSVTGQPDADGQPQVGAPVEIRVRWVARKRDILDAQGNTIALDAAAIVGQRIAVGSHLWLGTMDSWTGTGSDVDDQEIHEVKVYEEVPDLKGRDVIRSVGLMRLHNK